MLAIDPDVAPQCMIDGNSKQSEKPEAHFFKLFGQSPEALVFDTVLES